MHTDPQIAALEFIQNSPVPTLERFEVKHDGLEYNENWEETLGEVPPEGSLFTSPLPACLKVATLERIPNPYLFSEPNHPWSVGLTCLEVKFPISLPRPKAINAFLAIIPTLTVLSVDTRATTYNTNFDIHDQTVVSLPKVHLPNLRALGLLFTTDTSLALWEYDLLVMLDAPNVVSPRLWLDGIGTWIPHKEDFILYLAKGLSLTNYHPNLKACSPV
ncbi:hypothetical protein FRC11_009747 [Ceratobasidium sp. 423]|nr:hypothetical protein FRC11_009747 [Ceratobasidium sp. 423]